GGAGLVPGGDEPRAGRDQRVGDVEVAAADHPEDGAGAEAREGLAHGLRDARRPAGAAHRSTRASTRAGLPEPPTIGSGEATRTAPRAGSRSRFCSWVSPYLPAPRK